MPIPNISTLYQRISKGSEGGHEFARFVKLLLHADYGIQGINFISESDASGDYKKLDAYIPGKSKLKNRIKGFQFKFYPAKLSSNQKRQIIKSLEAALAENKLMSNFILFTPEDFMREEQEWWESLKEKYEKHISIKVDGNILFWELILSHWGHTKIIELSLKHDHIGHHYFPELYPSGTERFNLVSASLDYNNCNWLPFENDKYTFSPNRKNSSKHLTTDPVFDFHFINNSNNVFLLNTIEVHIEKVTTQLKGHPPEHNFLKSIATIEKRIDFRDSINTIEFEDPMIFEAKKPLRFKIQLNMFTKDCPGNCATIKFWFHFNNYSIPTESFYLSF